MEIQETRQKQATFWLTYSQQLSAAIRYVEALAAVERTIRLDETNVEAWYVRGTCLAMLARYKEALADFEHALTLDPRYVPAWDGKAWVLGILAQSSLAADKGQPDGSPPSDIDSGHPQGSGELKAEALAAVKQALALDPEYFEAQKRQRWLETIE